MTRTPSVYQQAILDFVKHGTGSAIVNAVAGSGKTTTLEMICSELSGSTRLLAFNKSISEELKSRGLPGSTFHSEAFRACIRGLTARNRGAKLKMDARKVANIIERKYGRESFGYGSALARLVSLAKNHCYLPTVGDGDIISLISHFDVEWEAREVDDREMCSMVRAVLATNNADTTTLDFDDQIYFVIVFDLKLDRFDTILVDESQDTNPLRREMVRRMMHATSRVIAVGDVNQAIYGFTGASHDSMQQIADMLSATWLPLSICYRCPQSVIQLAQTIVPHIEARPNAPEGQVLFPRTFKRSEFLPTDLLICRNTAPLVQTAYRLIVSRIPCKVMGREIGAGLTGLIRKLTRRNDDLEALSTRLVTYRDTEVSKALAEKKETKAQAIADKVDSIVALIESLTPDDVDGGIPRLIDIITGMFSDNGPRVTTLATVHKAKGMEAPRVFIVDASLMPSRYAKQDWQVQQEQNLMYVAYTRALDTLVFVDSKAIVE